MAKQLKKFTFKTQGGGIYPWDQWADGSIWEITRADVSDNTTLENFRVNLTTQSRRHGMRCRSNMNTKEGTLTFQFYKEE